jgi:delta 1-pyrroline-5-carboxylate dehydrogenase
VFALTIIKHQNIGSPKSRQSWKDKQNIMAPSATNGSNGTSKSTLDFTTFKNTYNGKLFDSEKHAHGINPATLEALPDVPIATKEDLTEAIKGARAAFKTWSKLPRAERNDYLVRFGEAMDEYSTQFAELLTKEQGKPVS